MKGGSMTYTEIHTLVAHGEPLPLFSSLPDRLCYEGLCMLKEKYEKGSLDEKGLRRFKQEVRLSHEEYTGAFQQYMAIYREYCDNALKSGQDIRNMLEGMEAKDPDWKALFLLAVGCIGRLQHDEATVRMIRDKAEKSASELTETCPSCGYIEERDWAQDDGFCPNCGKRIGEQNGKTSD